MLKAAAECQTVRIKHLLKLGVSLEYYDTNELTALHHAVLSGFDDTVTLLVNAGADVNAGSEEFGTPLCLAALKGRINIVSLLLDNRASVQGPGGGLGSPLHCACSTHNVSIVSMLVGHHAKVNEWREVKVNTDRKVGYFFPDSLFVGPGGLLNDLWSSQPLHIAICNNDTDTAGYLLKMGAFIDCGSSSTGGATPLMLAVQFGYCAAIGLLVENGAAMSAPIGQNSRPILMYASERGQAESAQQLIDSGAEIDERSNTGFTALIAATSGDHYECVKVLVDAGSNLDIQDNRERTALVWAVERRNTLVVEALLDAGANSVISSHGLSPMDHAAKAHADEIAHTLARYGAQFAKTPVRCSPIRLLNAKTLEYRVFGVFDSFFQPPQYATLSCDWEEHEISFRDFHSVLPTERSKSTSFKHAAVAFNRLISFCKEAERRDIEWIWCNTLCVDWTEKTELDDAVNFLIMWYKEAAVCFIYLRDLVTSSPAVPVLKSCKWFERS